MKNTDYNKIADKYDERYKENPMSPAIQSIKKIIDMHQPKKICEIGCGTGYWLNELKRNTADFWGIDYHLNMLQQAKQKNENINLICADAKHLPVKPNSADMLLFINSIHHFGNIPEAFSEAKKILADDGVLIILTIFPEQKNFYWYINEYFYGIREYDLNRFPSKKELNNLLNNLNFSINTEEVVNKVKSHFHGEEVFGDPFLQKHNSSQLASLSDEEYQKGISNIKQVLKQYVKRITFNTEFDFWMISAQQKI